MNRTKRCAHCRRLFFPDPRVKDQDYCSRSVCQRARKRRWQRQKMATDPDYQDDQKDCQKRWRHQHPDYWQNYRQTHPDYCERNRELQHTRDARRRAVHLAKMDALRTQNNRNPDTYYLVPYLAKMDSIPQKILLIPACSAHIADACKRGLDGLAGSFSVGLCQKGGAP